EAPPGAIEDAGARALDQPAFGFTAGGLLSIDLEIDVRVGPLEVGDHTGQFDLLARLVGRKRMMGPHRAHRQHTESEHYRSRAHADASECHRVSHLAQGPPERGPYVSTSHSCIRLLRPPNTPPSTSHRRRAASASSPQHPALLSD